MVLKNSVNIDSIKTFDYLNQWTLTYHRGQEMFREEPLSRRNLSLCINIKVQWFSLDGNFTWKTHQFQECVWELVHIQENRHIFKGQWVNSGLLTPYVMGLLPDRYKCELRMRQECWERFPRHRLQMKPLVQCLWNYIGTSAFADVSYLMADVEAKFYV